MVRGHHIIHSIQGEANMFTRFKSSRVHEKFTKPTSTYERFVYDFHSMSDPTTQSNYLDITTRNLSLEWEVDFEVQLISGKAVYELEVKKEGVREVMCVFALVASLVTFCLSSGSMTSILLTLDVLTSRFDTDALAIGTVEVEGETVEVSSTDIQGHFHLFQGRLEICMLLTHKHSTLSYSFNGMFGHSVARVCIVAVLPWSCT